MPPVSRATFRDRLLAEAVRLQETAESGDAEAAVRQIPLPEGADDEDRITRRAEEAPSGPGLDAAIDRAERTSALASALILTVALLAGAGAVGAVMGSGRGVPVNILAALVSLLGVQTVLLLLWFVGALLGPRLLRGASIGGFASSLAEWIFARAHKGRSQQAAFRAYAGAQFGGGIGRWTLSTITHATWMAFNLGVIVALFFALSTRNYVFVWETTILSQDTYERIFGVLGAPLELVGIRAPGERLIEGSRYPDDAAAEFGQQDWFRRVWGEFLLASIVLYGFAPRFVLAIGSVLARRHAQKWMRLDLTRPYYAALLDQSDVAGAEATKGSNAHPEPEVIPAGAERRPAPPRPVAAPAIIGFELDEPACGWPPPMGVSVRDLGIVDERESRTAALRVLREEDTEPEALVIVAALATTPDRGVERYLSELAGSVSRAVALVLTPGRALRSDHPDDAAARQAEMRLEDWRTLGVRIGIPSGRIVSVDLDRLTDASRRILADLMGDAANRSAGPAGKIGEAFDLIADAVERGRVETEKDRFELHERIARLYGAERSSGWLKRLNLEEGISAEAVRDAMTDGARRATSLLPDWLRSEPKWLAAGAVAGALGCASAALLVTPVAIGSLPLWSGFGAALGALGPALRATGTTPRSDGAVDVGETVRAAALWSALLELQGMPEDGIRRVLAETFPKERADASVQREGARAWLDSSLESFRRAARREGAA